ELQRISSPVAQPAGLHGRHLAAGRLDLFQATEAFRSAPPPSSAYSLEKKLCPPGRIRSSANAFRIGTFAWPCSMNAYLLATWPLRPGSWQYEREAQRGRAYRHA